jgi:hypothetical protein
MHLVVDHRKTADTHREDLSKLFNPVFDPQIPVWVIREPGARAMSKTIEQRLENVERELAELKGEIKTLIPRPNWISAITGTFKDDPEFDEVLQLGKMLREADQAKETD